MRKGLTEEKNLNLRLHFGLSDKLVLTCRALSIVYHDFFTSSLKLTDFPQNNCTVQCCTSIVI